MAHDHDAIAAEIRRRLLLLDACERDPDLRAIELERCRRDPVHWCNTWAWTYDPRNLAPIPKRLPFVLWPRQEELARWIVDLYETGRPGVLKKSRDVGATWLCGMVAAWLWLFRKDVSITFGSRKEALVDKLGNPNAILPKIRDVLDGLPAWQMPEGFERSRHDNFLRIINPQTGSVIVGEAGDEMGRGGRSSLYFADEWAFVERAERVDRAVAGNADCVIYLSTSNGYGTNFHQKETSGAYSLFRFSYRDDPRRHPHDEWAARKRAEVGPVAFAQEYDMDDGAAREGIVIPGQWVQAAVGLALPEGVTIAAGLDVAASGSAENVLCIRRGPVVRTDELIAWSDGDVVQTARRAINHCEDRDVHLMQWDPVGVGAGIEGVLREHPCTFRWEPANGSSKPSSVRYSDAPARPASDRFRNARAEWWWALRERFRRTYEHVTGVQEHHPSLLISIPDDAKLITQLSAPTYEVTEGGLIKIESKDRMLKRGVQSPDRADALVYTFARPAIAASARDTPSSTPDGQASPEWRKVRRWST